MSLDDTDITLTWGDEDTTSTRPHLPMDTPPDYRIYATIAAIIAFTVLVAAPLGIYSLGKHSGSEIAAEALREAQAAQDIAVQAAESQAYWQREAMEASETVSVLEAEVSELTTRVELFELRLEEASATVEAYTEENDRLKNQRSEAAPRAPVAVSRSGDGWKTATASWYGPGLYGNKTADGTAYTPETWCVAHKTLAFGTMVEIEYGGKTVKVPVKDRGPFTPGRDFDLSAAVRSSLGFNGVQTIRWRVVS